MRIITADETGLVKVVRLESGECLAVSPGEQARANAVRRICYDHATSATSHHHDHHQPSDFFARIHVARSAGAVETWDVSQSEREGNNNGSACALSRRGAAVDCAASPVALTCLPPASASSSEASRVLTCNGEGEVKISCSGRDGMSNNEATSTRFSIRGPISAAVVVGTSGGSGGGGGGGAGLSLAAGGKENDLKTWDISTGQCTWKAKNVPHDFLDMRQPVWVTSLCPLTAGPEASNGGGGGWGGAGAGSSTQLVAGTAHRQVRLYDTRAQKRPTHSVDADEHGITTMAVAPEGREVVVADTAGLVRVLDLRKMKWGRRFEGPAGSVRGLAFHPTLPVLACVGLDRMARVYDYRSREQKFQVYLKQRLNAVLFDEEGEVRVAADADADNGKKQKSGSAKESESWSGSEGWGSEEEYEMDEVDSSEEEEEAGRGGAAAGGGSNGGKPSIDDDSSSCEEEESGDDDVNVMGGGHGEGGSSSDGSDDDGDDDDDSESESEEEEEARPPPSKRRHVQKTSNAARKIKSKR